MALAALAPPALAATLPPTVNSAFGAASIPVGGSTSLTFTIYNPNPSTVLTGIAVTDDLPAGLVLAAPGASNSCGGTATAPPGSSVISLSGATLAANASCTVSVNVTGSAAGTLTDITGNITSTNGGTGNTASTSLKVVAPPQVSAAFSPPSIPVNGISTLTLSIANPAANTVVENGVALFDTLPSILTVATPSGISNTCGGTATAVAATHTISLTGGVIGMGATCTIQVNVLGGMAGNAVNTTGPASSTNGGTGGTATAELDVGGPTLAAAYGAGVIPVGDSTSLTFTLSNPNVGLTLNGAGFTDALPAGLRVATPNGLGGNCTGGTVSAVPGSNTITLSGQSLGPVTQCTLSIEVTGTAAGTQHNTVQSTSTQAKGSSASPSIDIIGPPQLSEAFAPSTFLINTATTLSFTVTNPAANPAALTGIGFSDTLPSGLTIVSPNALQGSCPSGTITATGGTRSIVLSGATLAPGVGCTFSVKVIGTSAGPHANPTDSITSANGGTGASATATATVLPPGPPRSRITTPAGRVKAKSLKLFRGTATAGTSSVARVAIALEEISGGATAARAKGKPHCWALGANGKLKKQKPKGRACPAPRFLAAHGTTTWTFSLKRRLPPGSYVLTSRATDVTGLAESAFSTRAGNVVRFTVR